MSAIEETTTIRPAGADDAGIVAALLHDFNTEYGTPTPDVDVLTRRLRRLLAAGTTFVLLAGEPAMGIALVTLRASVWYEGWIATLDELYVTPARRSRGLGARLLTAVEAEVGRRGGAVVEINVDGDDGGAPRFYRRHGYRNTEIGADVPLLYFFRELAP